MDILASLVAMIYSLSIFGSAYHVDNGNILVSTAVSASKNLTLSSSYVIFPLETCLTRLRMSSPSQWILKGMQGINDALHIHLWVHGRLKYELFVC